jgi:hypothetical protein
LVAVLAISSAAARTARAAPTNESESARRHVVVIGVAGDVDTSLRSTLHRLLEAELSRLDLALRPRDPDTLLGDWARHATARSDILLAALLDARNPESWRLVVIDAARRRAVARDLPGGAGNAANVEAAVSVILSAVSALREGLEVASTPVSKVVEGASAENEGHEPEALGTPAPTPVADSAPDAERTATPSDVVAVRGILGTTVAAFSSDAGAGFGLAAALAVSLPLRLELCLGAAHYFPVEFATAFGTFEVAQSHVSLSTGPRTKIGGLALVPEVGVIAERLSRSNAEGTAAVSTTQDRTIARFGAVAALRVRRALVGPLWVQVAAGGAYFGRSVRFVAQSPADVTAASTWPTTLFAGLAIDVASE